MRHIIKCSLALFFSLPFLFLSNSAFAEIYRWLDDNGRVQFSDSPDPNYNSQALANTTTSVRPFVDIKLLQSKAKELKQDRLKRERIAEKLFTAQRQKRLRNEKVIANKKKREQACYNAQKKENLAFRQRSKGRKLVAMRKALDRYEKKREIRIKKCR